LIRLKVKFAINMAKTAQSLSGWIPPDYSGTSLEFIARVTSHIPDKGQVMIRYYGLYANAHRGKMSKGGVSPSHPPIIEEEERFVPSKGWAEMIRKVYEVDPLLCPACGGQMSIISFIEDHKVIDRINGHLKLTFVSESSPPPQAVQPLMGMECMSARSFHPQLRVLYLPVDNTVTLLLINTKLGRNFYPET
jgi:hypothetical protein